MSKNIPKFEVFKHNFEQIIYILSCIVTLGGVYLLRIIITQGVLWAIMRRDAWKMEYECEKKEKGF